MLMKKCSNFRYVVILCSGVLIFLFGCTAATNNISPSPTDHNEAQPNSPETAAATHNDSVPLDELHRQIESYLDQLGEAGFSGAILVAQNGEVIIEKGYGWADVTTEMPITPETVFDSGSLSKQFTAVAILHLEEQELLQLDDTLSKFFDDVPLDKTNITLHQLLTHSSGLPEYVYGDDFIEISRQQAQRLAFEAELETPPGTEYLYSDTGYGLLAAIVEIVSEQSFQVYLKQHLFKPAGMVNTGFYNEPQWAELSVAHGYYNGEDFGSAATLPGPYWSLLGFGGVLTTGNDLHLWSVALDSNIILTDQSVAKLFTPYVKEFEDGASYYGYGWVVEELPDLGQVVWHDGATNAHNAIMLRYGDSNQTRVVVLSNRIDEDIFNETFYATDSGFILGNNILKNDFDELPKYGR